MRLMKPGISVQIVLAIFAFSVLYVSAVQAEEIDMKNLEVKLGFTRIPDEYTCVGSDTSPEIGIQGLNATSMAVIVDDPDAAWGHLHSLDHLEYSAHGHDTWSNSKECYS